MRLVVFILAIMFGSSALAGEVDFSAILTDADGAPIADCATADCAGKPSLTLGKLAMRVLTASFEDEKNLTGEDKFKRGELAMRVYKGGTVSLAAEEVALLKRLVAKGYGPLIVLRAWPLLDPAAGK
jgi:hypothetical protein